MHTVSAPIDVASPTLRSVGPPEVPYPGVLVGGERAEYRVSSEDAPAELWRASAGGHVLGPDDLDREGGTTWLVLPRMQRPIRAGDAAALSTGQAVTLTVSLLRGSAEAAELSIDAGSWWLTADGRPVLAPGGSRGWRDETIDLVTSIAADRPRDAVTGALATVLDALRAEAGFVRRVPALEDELFACAAAEPLHPTSFAAADRTDAVDHRAPTREGAGAGPSAVAAWVSRWVDSGVGRRVAAALDAIRPRRDSAAVQTRRGSVAVQTRRDSAARESPRPADTAPTSRPPRRRIVLVAAAALVATLGVGAVWPTADALPIGAASPPASEPTVSEPTVSDPDDRESTTSEPMVTQSVDAEPARPEPVVTETAASREPAVVAERVVAELAACADAEDAVCLTALSERSDAVYPDGAATLAGERSVSLLDDLGGVLVARVESAERMPQIVVIVEVDEKWLVRDVYDTADQP